LSEKDILACLQNLGLNKREMQTYLFLAKSGAQPTSSAYKRLKIDRVQTYRILKKLQEKGFIEATLERPTRFAIVPFEHLLSSLIENKMSEVKRLNDQKATLLSSWTAVCAPEPEYSVAKYLIIAGKKNIYAKIIEMIKASTKEVNFLTARSSVVQEDIAGIFDAILEKAKKQETKLKILADIHQENLFVIEAIYEELEAENRAFGCRHLILDSEFFPLFVIKDEDEALLYSSLNRDSLALNLLEEGLWINDRRFISILKAFFVQIWQNAVDARFRIEELKTGVPHVETRVIGEPELAWKKITDALDNAKEVTVITMSQNINRLVENDPLRRYLEKGLSFRIMAPIDLDNLDAARNLSAYYRIKHVPISYLSMMITGGALFMFKAPPPSEASNDSFFYLKDTFYTNDPRSIERVSEMLNDTWKRGTEISDITSQANVHLRWLGVPKTETVSKAAKMMLKENVNTLLVTDNEEPIGLVNEKDLLREIIEHQKNPETTLIGNIAFTPLISFDSSGSLLAISKTMSDRKIGKAVVLRNGQLVGMLAENSTPEKSQHE